MKKVFLIIVLFVVIGAFVSSCGGSKPPCPAYSQVETAQADIDV
jgi:outer membrane lipoprotein-sorting protein